MLIPDNILIGCVGPRTRLIKFTFCFVMSLPPRRRWVSASLLPHNLFSRKYTQSVPPEATSGFAVGGVLSTWIPPRLGWKLSWKGRHQPPSCSGIPTQVRSRWRGGLGGGASTKAVREWKIWQHETNCMSPTSHEYSKPYRVQVCSRISMASSCSAESAGMRPLSL